MIFSATTALYVGNTSYSKAFIGETQVWPLSGETTGYTLQKASSTSDLKKGDILGYVNVFCGENQIGRIPIKATEDVKKLTILVAAAHIFSKIFKL